MRVKSPVARWVVFILIGIAAGAALLLIAWLVAYLIDVSRMR